MRLPFKPGVAGKPAALRLIAHGSTSLAVPERSRREGGERSRTVAGKLSTWVWVAFVAASFWAIPSSANGQVDARLRQLAARASNPETWPRLAEYAASAPTPEQRGQADFVLGYSEYEAEAHADASRALRDAARTQFSLADYAEYYWASAAEKAQQPGQIVEALRGFSARHPKSPLRLPALELLVKGHFALGQAEQAIEALNGEPLTRQTPSLALLLGQAELRAQKLEEAARAFEQVYYAFPTEEESDQASEALRDLETRLGARFPHAGDDLKTLRAETLFNESRYAESLKEYDALLRAQPHGPMADRWRLGRARCQLRLRRYVEAAETLERQITADPAVEAARLATLVEVDGRRDDTELMLRELEDLAKNHAQDPAYAAALSFVAGWFWRQRSLDRAAHFDRLLAESFPQSDLGREGNWNLAWSYYLARQSEKARRALADHVLRYPDSPHVPAALYWLGRLAAERQNPADARLLYEFLNKRFAHRYYAVLASARLKEFPPPEPVADGKGRKRRPKYGPFASPILKVPSRQSPPFRPCVPLRITDSLRPYVTFKLLSLYPLAGDYLAARLAFEPKAPELLLTLSRAKAQQREFSAALIHTKDAVPNFSDYDFQDLPEEVWELLFPRAFVEIVEREAQASGLDPALVLGVIRQESAFNPRAISRANARGLMQILPQTAHPSRRGRAAVSQKLYDPEYNVRFGCRYLRRVIESFKGNLEQALAAYNAGDPRVNHWVDRGEFREPAEFLETIPIHETRVYVEAVLRDAEVYRQLIAGSAKFKVCR